jgi:hypothetical protein
MAEINMAPDSLPDLVEKVNPALVENALTQALPLPDIMFGGAVLLIVIMFHVFGMRVISDFLLKRAHAIRMQGSMLHADLLFTMMVMSLLALHLAEIVIWSAALVFADIAREWSMAAYFAANCYTALGEPFSLPRAWRIVPPIIAISGIFAFAGTASVMVNFLARYNDLRAAILGHQ